MVGGASGAGKTTAARWLSARLGCAWLQADTIWCAAQALLAEGSADWQALQIGRAIREGRSTLEELTRQHVAAAEVVCRGLEAAVLFELRTTHDTLVVDGAWLLPAWIAGLHVRELDVEVRAAIIHEPDAAEVKRAMRARTPAPATLPHQRTNAAVAALYGDWLRAEALAHHLPVVAARPRATLQARVAAALGASVGSSQ